MIIERGKMENQIKSIYSFKEETMLLVGEAGLQEYIPNRSAYWKPFLMGIKSEIEKKSSELAVSDLIFMSRYLYAG